MGSRKHHDPDHSLDALDDVDDLDGIKSPRDSASGQATGVVGSYETHVDTAREAGSGMATGRRQYEPLVDAGDLDGPDVDGEFFRPNPTGDGTTQQVFHNITWDKVQDGGEPNSLVNNEVIEGTFKFAHDPGPGAVEDLLGDGGRRRDFTIKVEHEGALTPPVEEVSFVRGGDRHDAGIAAELLLEDLVVKDDENIPGVTSLGRENSIECLSVSDDGDDGHDPAFMDDTDGAEG